MNDNHVHEVMHMMLETKATYTRESLISAIKEKFGSDATFHSCSIPGMSSVQAVDFLHEKGKFVGDSNGFMFDPARVCNH